MDKEFGYPQYNQNDEKILTTYQNEFKDMLMDIMLKKLKKGESIDICKVGEETAVLLIQGQIEIVVDGNTINAQRNDVFTQNPWCVHFSEKNSIKFTALMDSEILIQSTHNTNNFETKIYKPEEISWVYSGKGLFGDTANRRVSTIFDYNNAPYSNMVMGEVLNDRGNWSSFVPHSHQQPEVYYFKFDRPEGFGASFIGDNVYKIKDGSFSAIGGGYTHPQVTAPGYQMYTCWMIRHLDGNPWTTREDDPEYTWLYEAKFEND